MMTVTFPSGVRVTYNSASETEWFASCIKLIQKDENGKRWIVGYVLLSSGAIIEHVSPCQITAPPIPSPDVALDTLLKQAESGELRSAATWKIADLKRALGKFNARSRSWR